MLRGPGVPVSRARAVLEGEEIMKRFILTGAPGAGKTSILRALAAGGYAVVPEAATDVVTARLALEEAEVAWATAGGTFDRRLFFVRLLGFIEATAVRRISYAESQAFEQIHEEAYLPRDSAISIHTDGPA
jgi:predicted ATPase